MKNKLILTQRVLSRTQITLADYTINPYRGCEFGCLYCYTQDNKNLKGKELTQVKVKINSNEVLKKELKKIKPARVLLGSTTECFQYKEKDFQITEKILKTLNNTSVCYTILTKSHLISDYLWLIKQNPGNKIYFTLNFQNDSLIRAFEEKSSSLKQRLTAIDEIQNHKINLRIHIGPFIPYISNLEEIFKLIPKEITEVDIELYHNKQGNFQKILKKTTEVLGKQKSESLKAVYDNVENYNRFIKQLKNKIIALNPDFKVFCIALDYDKFYDSKIIYSE